MKSELQLSLLKGPRQKGELPPQASEFELHVALADTLRISLSKGWMWFHCPNGGWRTKAEAAKFHRMGVKAGVPDIILIDPSGKHYYLEIKTKYGCLTEEQQNFLCALDERNVARMVTWGYDDAIAWLKAWGAVRVKI